MKRCCVCAKTKSVNEFYKNRSRKDGIESRCKECTHTWGRRKSKLLWAFARKHRNLWREFIKVNS